MIRIRSFKLRLTLWYALMLTVFLAGFAFLMYAELSRALYRDVEQGMTGEALSVEKGLLSFLRETNDPKFLSPPGITKGTLAFPPDFQGLLEFRIREFERRHRRIAQSLFLVRIVGLDHAVISSNLGGWEREVIFPDYERDSVFMEKGQSYQTIHFRNNPIRLYYHLVRFRGRPFFIIQTAKRLSEIDQTLARLARIYIVIIPIGVAAACFAGWFLSKRFLNPVDQMIRQARKITAAYLQDRLPRTQTRDELDRLAETLNEMIDRLEASTRAVQEFSSNVSHEFKTPLAIIRGEIDLALRRVRSAEDLHQSILVIDEEVNGLIRLVDDLMLLVRSDARQLNLQVKTISLVHTLEHVVKLYQERARREEIEMTLEVRGDVQINGDEVHLKRLFMNLLDNALKFTEAGGKIKVRADESSPQAVVSIEDTGIGIDPETLKNLGKRFYRADQARSREGAGLGLSIVRAICDAHQASCRIESVLGQGTQVYLNFPLVLSGAFEVPIH
ncbi:MAG: HAMP domain-containing histidine kinase [Candidatus Omnitrophica bacterium]|nr:HAMP domain-containing histidine kinase [Candidatus Omnitrophota bacterium]